MGEYARSHRPRVQLSKEGEVQPEGCQRKRELSPADHSKNQTGSVAKNALATCRDSVKSWECLPIHPDTSLVTTFATRYAPPGHFLFFFGSQVQCPPPPPRPYQLLIVAPP